MRKLIVNAFMTLDGVMQAPGGPEEDPSSGFEHGGWAFAYWDDVVDETMHTSMADPFDLLLGRKTYEMFAAHWPDSEEPAAALIYLVVFDFIGYWTHRGQHQLEWWWQLHSLHHSQRQMTMWSDNRSHLLDSILDDAAARELARLGARIESLYGRPMDIEWALHDGSISVVQARPITVTAYEEWNCSLAGDYLWTCANLGEAIPSVMTPATSAKTPRKPSGPTSRLPAGTPTTSARVSPLNTAATARPRRSGGLSWVATRVAAGVKAAAPSALRMRAASSGG